jgi:4-hydroxybenzoate polyprenyltransferase
MTHEFFVRDWLRVHPAAYLISHMAIMPMIDTYTTGLDWIVAGARPSPGLGYFLLVTFLNGTVIEVGRKIRASGCEREGVDTYTKAWGIRGAPAVWLIVLLTAAVTAWLAARYTGAGSLTAAMLMALAFAASFPAIDFLRAPGLRAARSIEKASGLWILASYLLLGSGPFLARWLTR